MKKFVKFFEYAYLLFAILFIGEAIRTWGSDRNRAYLSLFFVALALGMFFFKRHFRKKYDKQNNP
ncbi:MAG: hypothetical protein CL868_13920 [Cytophagaceae bacterium]|nr:hypothetical protein [Cytophagaceae bacterium]|tara:strand:+ start:1830 stop:2024 length:195 start_codon:yes stop_codon:yes gene_type:complete